MLFLPDSTMPAHFGVLIVPELPSRHPPFRLIAPQLVLNKRERLNAFCKKTKIYSWFFDEMVDKVGGNRGGIGTGTIKLPKVWCNIFKNHTFKTKNSSSVLSFLFWENENMIYFLHASHSSC